MQTLSFVPINLHRCWSHDLNRSITGHRDLETARMNDVCTQ